MKWAFSMGRGPQETPNAGDTEARNTPGSPTAVLVLWGLWLGIVVGFTEVAGIVAAYQLAGQVSKETLRTNWHFAWMIPVSYGVLFGAVGILLSFLEWLCPRRWRFQLSAYAFCFLAIYALSLWGTRIHWVAKLILAIGAARYLGAWATRHRNTCDHHLRWALPSALVVLAGVTAWQWSAVSNAEQKSLAALPHPVPGKPNVLLIVLDTVRFDGVFPDDASRDPTPFLTRLGQRGIRFDQARTTASWTLPSHASLFTGRWPHQLSVRVEKPLDEDELTLAEHLAQAGYATAAFVGNSYNCNSWYGLDQGFAHYEDFYENQAVTPLEVLRSSRLGFTLLISKLGQRAIKTIMEPPRYIYRKSAAMINQDALAWLDHAPRKRPFFVFLNYYDAHRPYEELPSDAPRPFSGDPAHATRSRLEQLHDEYNDCLAYLDSQLEDLFDKLRARGLLENTLVVLTSDHGEAFGEHRLEGHGLSLYRPEIHVPLLVILPSGASAGQKVREPVSLRDVAATIVHQVLPQQPSPFPGSSLASYWSPEDTPADPSTVLSEVDLAFSLPAEMGHAPVAKGQLQAIVTGGHLYIHNGDGTEELYDLEHDPYEENNQAGDRAHEPAIEHSRRALEQTLSSAKAPNPVR